jgi:hypothetical protein
MVEEMVDDQIKEATGQGIVENVVWVMREIGVLVLLKQGW